MPSSRFGGASSQTSRQGLLVAYRFGAQHQRKNVDSFTGREITALGDPPSRQALALLNYMWSLAMPPIIIDYGSPGYTLRAATGETNRFGDPVSSYGQAALRAFGVNIYALEPEHTRNANLMRMRVEIGETETLLKRKLQDRSLTDVRRKKLLTEYTAELNRRHDQLLKYQKDSEINPKQSTPGVLRDQLLAATAHRGRACLLIRVEQARRPERFRLRRHHQHAHGLGRADRFRRQLPNFPLHRPRCRGLHRCRGRRQHPSRVGQGNDDQGGDADFLNHAPSVWHFWPRAIRTTPGRLAIPLCYVTDMAHAAQFDFVERIRTVFPEHFEGRRVLEIGSLNINGSVRQFFSDCDYTGIDVAPGAGVDVVCGGQSFDAPAFDVVISCEAMEHNPHWIETMRNMVRLCKPTGLILMTCATSGRPEHGTSSSQPSDSPLTVGMGWDYYRNLTADDLIGAGVTAGLGFCQFFTNWPSHDLYMVALKRRATGAELTAMRGVAAAYRRNNCATFRGLRNMMRVALGIVSRGAFRLTTRRKTERNQ
jgi:SAM-dependent methyltransferase